MTIAEISLEIQKETDQLQGGPLLNVLAVLQQLKVEIFDEIRRQRFFKQVLEADSELLKRFAPYDTEL